jgi:hypothetical protein
VDEALAVFLVLASFSIGLVAGIFAEREANRRQAALRRQEEAEAHRDANL